MAKKKEQKLRKRKNHKNFVKNLKLRKQNDVVLKSAK